MHKHRGPCEDFKEQRHCVFRQGDHVFELIGAHQYKMIFMTTKLSMTLNVDCKD